MRQSGLRGIHRLAFHFAPQDFIRDALVTLQIGGSLVMLTAAGLMLRTLWKLESVPLGLDTEHVVTAQFTLGSNYNPARLRSFSETLDQRPANQPGLTSVAFADSFPPGGLTRSIPFFVLRVSGHPAFQQGVGGMVPWRAVSSDYFQTFHVRLLQGHAFDGSDKNALEHALRIILSQSLARKLLPGENPIGQRVTPANREHTLSWASPPMSAIPGWPARRIAEFYLDRDQFSAFWVRGITRRHFAIAIRATCARSPSKPGCAMKSALSNPRSSRSDDYAGPRSRLRRPATFSCHIVQPFRRL